MKRTFILALGLAIAAALWAMKAMEEPPAPPPAAKPQAGPTPADARLQAQLRILDEWRVQDRLPGGRSPFYFLAVAGMFKHLAQQALPSLEGITIAEIGPGSSLIPGVLFVSAGARHYFGIDLYQDPAIHNALAYRTALGLAYVDPDYRRRDPAEIFLREDKGKAVLNPQYITYLNRPAYDTGLASDSVDFLYSMATIEHLDDPERSIAEWKRVLKPGGISAHHAALVDHRDFSKPYEYLKIEPDAWKAQFGPGKTYPEYDYVNSWRAIDFIRAFRKAGFEVLRNEPDAPHPYFDEQNRRTYPTQLMGEAEWAQIAPSIRAGRTREEVSQIYITVVVRKPGQTCAAAPGAQCRPGAASR
ncbi:MAG: class I SAM-dependent methyltransferase [Proteobacteria bacterium]|nr:class I SAM-dependent methyltransferase [Pseudomonadota bacterium]